VVNAGPFMSCAGRAGGHDLGLYPVARWRDPGPDADEIFTLTEQGLGFFADVFEMPFPQRKFDQVLSRVRRGHGELRLRDVVGLVLYRIRRPGRARPAGQYLLHEAAHMWFGTS